MTVLLDANVLIALVVAEHVHHDAAADWLMASDTGFATCPMTQGSLFDSWCARDSPRRRLGMSSVRSSARAATNSGPMHSLSPVSRSLVWLGTGR